MVVVAVVVVAVVVDDDVFDDRDVVFNNSPSTRVSSVCGIIASSYWTVCVLIIITITGCVDEGDGVCALPV